MAPDQAGTADTLGQGLSPAVLAQLRGAYAAGRDADLGAALLAGGFKGDDLLLSDLINADGRLRLEHGLAITLDRYLNAIPGLPDRAEAIDTAIEMVLRSMCALGESPERAVGALESRFPELARAIRTASMLGDVLCSTSGLGRSLAEAGRTLPEEFGPALRDGRRRYELREFVGSGAHGSVFLAADRQLSDRDRPAWVAIKILGALGDADETRLADEATKARRVDHPNVVRVLDRGASENGEPYLAYEYVRSGDLASFVAGRPGPIPEREAATLVARMAHGLQAAHSAGLAHCDLKPANVLLTDDGQPKVADFGVAVRLQGLSSQSGYRRLGSMAFVAPEQYRGEPGALSPLADTYAAGGILYWLLTRRYPNGDTPEEVHRNLAGASQRTESPDPGMTRAMDTELAAICRRALDPDPRKRYASAEALASDLESWTRHEPLKWTVTSNWRRARLLAVRQPLAVGLGLALAAAVIGGVWGAIFLHQRTVRSELEGQVRLAQQQSLADRTKLEQVTTAFASTAKFIKSFKSNEDDWMPPLTIVETMAGPTLAGDVVDPELREARIGVVRKLLADARAGGHENQFEPMLWETVLGYWLLRGGSIDEASAVLDSSRARWLKRVDVGDPWLVAIDALRACAAGRRAMASKSVADMRSAASALATIHPASGGFKTGRLVERQVMQTQLDLHGPDGLNDPAKYMEFQEALKAAK